MMSDKEGTLQMQSSGRWAVCCRAEKLHKNGPEQVQHSACKNDRYSIVGSRPPSSCAGHAIKKTSAAAPPGGL